MFKRISLVGLIGWLLVVGNSGYAKEVKPNCEIGDAIFRPLNMFLGIGNGFGHVGIYCCSQSDRKGVTIDTAYPYHIKITNSDFKHSMIQANGYKKDNPEWPSETKEVDFDTLDFALAGLKSWGAYNSGNLTAEKRRWIVATAYKYAVEKESRYNHNQSDKIKNPTGTPFPTFRCDGLVEYCYEVIGVNSGSGFFTDEEEKHCWSEWLDKKYTSGVWPTFYPKALMERMKKAGGKQVSKPPQILSFKLYKGAKEIKEGGLLKKNDVVTIKPYVTDTDEGSGIDRVALYYQEVYGQLLDKGTPTLITTLDDDEDIGKEYSYDWTVPETLITFTDCELSVVAYDRAGNTIGTVSKFWTGSPGHVKEPFRITIDNIHPQVSSITPANNATKVNLSKKIRITFSEEMGAETINSNTILVNNGSVVGSITYNEDLRTAFFVPEEPLGINTNYTVLVKGGSNGVTDKAGNSISSDYTFSFTTTNGLIQGKVIEIPVTYTDEYGKEHPVPAGTQIMSSYWLKSSGVETYIVYPGTPQWVEEDGKVRFNQPGGNVSEQKFRVFFESKGYSLIKNTPSFWVFMDKTTTLTTHSFASQLFDIHKLEGSDVYVPVEGTITIHCGSSTSIPHWGKLYPNRTGALHTLGAFNQGFDYIVTHDQGINPVDYASWMETLDFTPEEITCYGTNTADKWRILVNGIEKDEWSEDRLLASAGNLLMKRFGENYDDYKLILRPEFNRRTDVFQAWLNGFSHYYSCISRGTATIEVRDVDTQITNTYNLESLGSQTRGLDNEAAVAAALWKMKDPYHVWKAIRKYDNIITPTHKGFNVQDFWRELGTQSYISMPEQIWLSSGLMPKLKYATSTNTPNPQLFWDRNGILDDSIALTYTLEIATDSTFANLVFVKTQINDENYHLTDINLDNGIYYWRIRVGDEYLTGNLQNALPNLYSPIGSFEIRLPKKAGITVISDPNTQGIPSDVIVAIYDEEGSIYTGAYWAEYDQANRTKILDLRYTPITVHFDAQGGSATVPQDYIFEEGSCVHTFENGIIFNEPGTYAVNISMSGKGINIPSISHSGMQVAPKGIVPHHFHVVDILDPIDKGEASNVSLVVHDVHENLVIGYAGSVYFTATDLLAILPQTYTLTASNYGVKTFVDGVVLNTPGTQTVFAIDANNPQIMGSQTVYVKGTETQTRIIVKPTFGAIGTIVTVMGEGFGASELVRVEFGTTRTIVTVPTSATGKFEAVLTVNSQPIGTTTVAAYGMITNTYAMEHFVILSSTLCVPGSYTTIQLAIDTASNGDTVLVDNGTYTENINFLGKAITVQSVYGTTSTIIDGNARGSVVTFGSGEGTSSVLSGFTIRNGSASYGGGIYCGSSSPTITNCTISGNSASNGGGGIYCDFSSPVITNCTISRNSAFEDGGGIYCFNSSPTIANNILWENSPQEIYLDSSSINITYSNIKGGWAGEGNINTDPLFVDTSTTNYRLQATSPCIDRGTNTAPNIPSTDKDGNPRIANGTVDMGAYEFQGIPATNTTHTWIDATTGTPIDFPALDDGTKLNIPLGFDFQFYGQRFNTINVCTNGFMGFITTGLDYRCTEQFPRGTYSDYNGAPMVDMIAPLWTDWSLAPDSHGHQGTGTVYYLQGGISPNRYLVVEFHNILHFDGDISKDSLSTFEAVLHESGKIQFNYKQVGYIGESIVGLNYGDGILGTTTLWRVSPGSNTSIEYSYLTSRAEPISPYINASVPIGVPFQAYGDELASIGLYYKHSIDNITWGTWTSSETKIITGTSAAGTFSFNCPEGQGYYQFYTLDSENNTLEYAPQLADTACCLQNAAILIISGTSMSPSVIQRGVNNVPIETIILSTGVGTITIDSIKIQRSGSCTDADISLVSLYKNDIRIGTRSFINGYAVFTGLNMELAPNTSNNVSVKYNIYASATLGNTIGMTLSEPASIGISGQGTVSSINLPITSKLSMVSCFNLAQELTGVSISSAIWGDYDADGDMDILISGLSLSGNICKVFRNDQGTFSLAANLPGISHAESANASSWGDYDNDGDIDIAITGLGSSVIYRNTAGNFESINANLPGLHSSSIVWGDYDNDGDIDLALAGNSYSLGRIARIYQNNNGVFTDINANLTGISQGALSWVDYNNDGRLDLSINGEDSNESHITKVYNNKDNNIFEDSGIILPGIYVGCLAWADYDNDGDMDVALTGGGDDGRISRIYRNDNGTFTDINAGLQGVWISFASWGDYNNDGFLDLALIGKPSGMGDICNIYRNKGNGSFTLDTAINLPGIVNGAINWGDYDHDGDTDILIVGASSEGGIARIYRNDTADYNPNNPPAPPDNGFGAIPDSGIVTLNWGNGSDIETVVSGLYYNLRVGTSSGKGNIISPLYGSPLLGRYYGLKGKTMKLKAAPDTTYYWAVQSIDAGLLAGTWSTEQVVYVPEGTHVVITITTQTTLGTISSPPVPGAEITYIITYENIGGQNIQNLSIMNKPELTHAEYITGSLRIGTVGSTYETADIKSDAQDGDGAAWDGGIVIFDVGNVPAEKSGRVYFRVRIK